MSGPDWDRVAEIFADVLEAAPEEREAVLSRLCGDDPELRAAVERMLAADASAGTRFLDEPDPALLSEAADVVAAPPVERVGPWRLVREIGRGGMGRVFLGERDDGQFDQQVAVKLLKRGMDSDAILARFLRERQILAGLDHPNIARLLDGGVAEDGRPYFVMERVDGDPITTYADERRLDVEARIRLFRTVCQAVAHAHRNLVVHRDLKPSNILVTREGHPKLLDFGIAKLLDAGDGAPGSPTLTVGDVRLLSPAYAAPEQITGDAITTSTDVFGLGAVLYELLSGRPPFDDDRTRVERPYEVEPESLPRTTRSGPSGGEAGAAGPAAVAAARSTEPARLRRRLSGDLETIVAVAMRGDPERRYPSAAALEEDLRRHAEGRPVEARPDTVGYRVSRFVRRNPVPVAATALTVLVSVAFGVTATLQSRALAAERDRAQREAVAAREATDFMIGVFDAANPMAPGTGDTVRASDLLERGAQRVEDELAGQPALQARLLSAIGEAYSNLGWSDRAEPLLARSVAIHEELGEIDADQRVAALYRLGSSQSNRGQYAEAAATLAEAIRIQDESGSDPSLGWRLRVALSWVHHSVGEVEAGRAALNEAVERFRRTPYEGGLGERSDLSALTALLGYGSDPVWADSILGEIAALEAAESGPGTERHAAVLAQWARARAGRGDDAFADSLMDVVVETRRALDPTSLVLADALVQQTSYASRLDEPERMLALVEEAIRVRGARMGEDHVDLGASRALQAQALARLGRTDQAVATLRRVVDTYREVGYDFLVGPNLDRLARVLENAGRLEEADTEYRAAIDAFLASFPEDYLLTANTRLGYGEMLAGQGRAREAEVQLRAALPVLANRWGEESRQADLVRVPLGVALADQGRSDEARALLGPVVARLEIDPGPEDPLTRRAAETLSRVEGRPVP